MEKIFKYEKDLVDAFIKNYFNQKNKVTLRELPIRWGNIDIVCIEGNRILPFSREQIEVLSKPSNAKIFMRTKKNRPISKTVLFNGLGISKSTFDSCLSFMCSLDLISTIDNKNYIRNVDYTFPKVKIIGYEAKLTDYNKSLYQACINKNYVDYSYIVFPMNVAKKIAENYFEVLKEHNIGLIGATETKTKILIKAQRNKDIKQYIKLMTLLQSV